MSMFALTVCRRSIVSLSLLVLASCATGPIEETRSFEQSANIVKSASDVLYDQLALAERNTKIRIIEREPGSAFNFKVDNAYYYSTLGDPPQTAEFRSAISIVGNYAMLMRSLVDGSANQASRVHILAIAKDISALTSQPELSAVATALTPIIDRLLLVRSQAEAKRIALEGAPVVSELVAALRDATPAMFKLLVADIARTAGINSPKLREYKVALANYVVVLDRLQVSFDGLVEAYRNPSNPATLAALAQATGALQSDVDSLRKALAAART
jgi:hypothetical protein